MWHTAKSRCKEKNISFNIDEEDIVIPMVCPILGTTLSLSSSKKPECNTPSLDRIDPKKGYVKGNVAVISRTANRMKQDNTVTTLKRLIKYMELER